MVTRFPFFFVGMFVGSPKHDRSEMCAYSANSSVAVRLILASTAESSKLCSLAINRMAPCNRRALAPAGPVVFALDLCGRQWECGPGVSASGQQVVEQVCEILHALFLDEIHERPHRHESGAANIFSPNGTT